MMDVLWCRQVFFHSTLSIYFSSMECIGLENVPQHGPVIFTGNHMNQFVDAAVIVVTCPRKVGFLVAEKSMRKPIIGDFARALGSVGVSRPQDYAKRGAGAVTLQGLRVLGRDTQFTRQFKPGDKLRPGRSAESYRLSVLSDTEALLVEEVGEASPLHEPQGVELSYDVLEHVDQALVFRHVHAALADGNCIGIFPEGGSHDHTDLLPLKAGVSVIAFGALDKYDVNARIVPVGLNYFRGTHSTSLQSPCH